MLRRQVEIDGKKFTLGESVAAELEDCQDTMRNEALDGAAKTAACRRFVAHCLNRGGHSITAEALGTEFTTTENVFLYREALTVSGARALPEGEVLGP